MSQMLSKSMPIIQYSAEPPSTGQTAEGGEDDPYAKKPFIYRGKLYDTTTVMDKSILRSRDISKKLAILPPLPCSASYTNLNSWTVDNSAVPEIQDAYIGVVKHVLFREVALQGLKSVLKGCDETYWKYANLKVDAVEKNKNCNGGSFSVLLRSLSRLQEELAVALAHLRSLSISVVEGVMQWRMANRKNKSTQENVSLYWKKQNYLIKMLTDTTEILNEPILWMWVGCDPSIFLLTPHGHNQADSWREREAMYQDWLAKHKEHVQRALGKMKELTRVSMGRPTYQPTPTPPAPIAADPPVKVEAPQENKPSLEKTFSSYSDDGNQDNVDRTRAEASSFIIMNNRNTRVQHRASDSDVSDEPEGQLEAPGPCSPKPKPKSPTILLLSTRSSGGVPRPGSSGTMLAPKSNLGSMEMLAEEQHVEEDEEGGSQCEENEDHSLAESTEEDSEASSEVSEAWKALRKTCMDSWLCMKGTIFEEKKDPFWDNMDHSAVVIQAAVGFTETMPKKVLLPQLNHAIVMLCQHLENELHREKRTMEMLQEYKADRMEFKKNVLSAVESQGIEWALQHSKSWHAFEAQNLLKFRQQYCPPLTASHSSTAVTTHPASAFDEFPRGFSRGVGGSPPRSAGDCLPSFSKMHDMNFDVFLTEQRDADDTHRVFTAGPIAINREKTIARSVDKVEEDRHLTARVRDSVVVVKSRKSKRAMVEKMRVTPAAILLQAAMRGHLARRALERKRAAMRMFHSAMLIQRGIRRVIARYRAQRLKLFHRREGFIARREVLKKNKCAFVVTKFMRWAAFIVRKTKSELQVSSISKISVMKQLKRYGKGSLKVQSMFRGHMTRKRLASVVVDTAMAMELQSLSDASSVQSTTSLKQEYGSRMRNEGFGVNGSRSGLLRQSSSSNLSRQNSLAKPKKKLSGARRPSRLGLASPMNSFSSAPATPKKRTISPAAQMMLLESVDEALRREVSEAAEEMPVNMPEETEISLHVLVEAPPVGAVVKNSLRMRAVRPAPGSVVIRQLDSIFTATPHTSPQKEAFPPDRGSSRPESRVGFSKKGTNRYNKSRMKKEEPADDSKPADDGMEAALRAMLL